MKVLSYNGSTDGLRWGDVRLGPVTRRFTVDLLSGKVRLFDVNEKRLKGGAARREDCDPERLALAHELLFGATTA